MMDFIFNYALFFLKVLTLALAFGLGLAFLLGARARSSAGGSGHLKVLKLNEQYERHREALTSAVLDDVAYGLSEKKKRADEKKERKAKKKEFKKLSQKSEDELEAEAKPRVFVLEFDGDLQASAVESLRCELSAILGVAQKNDEVMVRLESGGGLVHAYGLAAAQLMRVKKKGLRLTVCVDKVAASGGYMMACVADSLIAAPFAAIGSIGVMAQIPNFRRLLQKHDVDVELLTAGEHKRTLTMFGENTEQDRKKFTEDLEDTHALFKDFVTEQRPQLDIQKIATGEVWYGKRAIDLALVDELGTSDEYLLTKCAECDVLQVTFQQKKGLQETMSAMVEMTLGRVLSRLWSQGQKPLV
ncbi:MAG: protease SohB [Polyangiaceae bacterium]|nr:protease SohB [Polyangiaceae bacterium]